MIAARPKPERVERGQVWLQCFSVWGLYIVDKVVADDERMVHFVDHNWSVPESRLLTWSDYVHLGMLDPALIPEER